MLVLAPTRELAQQVEVSGSREYRFVLVINLYSCICGRVLLLSLEVWPTSGVAVCMEVHHVALRYETYRTV